MAYLIYVSFIGRAWWNLTVRWIFILYVCLFYPLLLKVQEMKAVLYISGVLHSEITQWRNTVNIYSFIIYKVACIDM